MLIPRSGDRAAWRRVLVIDDSGDGKDGAKTAHVGHQWLGRYGIWAYGPMRTPRSMRPAPWPGTGRKIPASGGR